MWSTVLTTVMKMVVSSLIQYAMAKYQSNDEAPGKSELREKQIPTASNQDNISTFFGTMRFKGGNVLWYGDTGTSGIYDKKSVNFISDAIFGEIKVKVGYKYYLGFQMGLGLAIDNQPIKLKTIYTDDDDILYEHPGKETGGFIINKPTIFNTDSSNNNNGWSGEVSYYDGTQTSVDSYMSNQVQNVDVPIFKDFAHIVFHKNYIGNQNTLKTIEFELDHRPVPHWGSYNYANIGDDYNPVYALYYFLTDPLIGAGLSDEIINISNFDSIAQTLSNEGIGVSIEVSNKTSFKSIKENLEQVIDGYIDVNYTTGLYEIKLNRADDIVESELPVLTENEISNFSWEKATTGSVVTEMKVGFQNREKGYKDDLAIFSDIGMRYNKGSYASASTEYDWVKDPNVANKIASRDLKSLSYPLTKAEFELPQKYIELNRGDVIRVQYTPDKIDLLFKITEIDYGNFNQNNISISAVEDFFSKYESSYAPPQQSQYVPMDLTAQPTNFNLFELPYFFNPSDKGSIFKVAAEKPTNASVGYNILTDYGSTAFEEEGEGDFCPTALLENSIGFNDTTLSLYNGSDLNILESSSGTEIRRGINFFVIDDGFNREFCVFESIVDDGDGTWTLSNVHRGIFYGKKTFGVDAKLYFINENNSVINKYIAQGDNLNVKLLTRTTKETLDEEDANTVSKTSNALNKTLYTPKNIKLKGEYYDNSKTFNISQDYELGNINELKLEWDLWSPNSDLITWWNEQVPYESGMRTFFQLESPARNDSQLLDTSNSANIVIKPEDYNSTLKLRNITNDENQTIYGNTEEFTVNSLFVNKAFTFETPYYFNQSGTTQSALCILRSSEQEPSNVDKYNLFYEKNYGTYSKIDELTTPQEGAKLEISLSQSAETLKIRDVSGTPLYLTNKHKSFTETQIKNGENICVLKNENSSLFEFVSYENDDGNGNLTGVKRGLFSTPPLDISTGVIYIIFGIKTGAGEIVFYDDSYSEGDHLSVYTRSVATNGYELDDSIGQRRSDSFNHIRNEANRNYSIKNVQFNSQYYPNSIDVPSSATAGDEINISWGYDDKTSADITLWKENDDIPTSYTGKSSITVTEQPAATSQTFTINSNLSADCFIDYLVQDSTTTSLDISIVDQTTYDANSRDSEAFEWTLNLNRT